LSIAIRPRIVQQQIELTFTRQHGGGCRRDRRQTREVARNKLDVAPSTGRRLHLIGGAFGPGDVAAGHQDASTLSHEQPWPLPVRDQSSTR